jgi:hypothetical protein
MGKSLALGVILGLHAGCVLAADPDSQIRNTFIEPWAQAMQANDPEKLARFLHPQVLACRNARTKEYFDDFLRREIENKVKPGYRVTRIEALRGPSQFVSMVPADAFSFPVQATYEIQIEIDEAINIRALAPDANGRWYEVIPCPNDKGIAMTHAGIEQRAEQEKRVAQLASELKDPLLSELKNLLQREQLIEAMHRYQAATGADMTTAHGVIEKIRPPH